MSNNNELTMIETELATANEIKSLRETLAESRQARRSLPKPEGALEVAQQAYDEAQVTLRKTKGALAAQEIGLAELEAQQKAGDRSVTANSIRAVRDEIETLTNYLGADEKALRQAQRALRPLLADEHLAYLAADALESITDVPVVVYKTPSEAPDIEPLVIVSQTTATESYGSLEANGSVRLTTKGTKVDTTALQTVLERAGSEVSVNGNGIVFDVAAWPTPRLSEPSVHALAELMLSIERAFKSQVAGGGTIGLLARAGYNVSKAKSVWAGLIARGSESLEITAPGEVVGTAVFCAAIQHDRGDSASVEDIKRELDSIVATFQSEAIGGWSEAGEIVSIELVGVDTYRGHANPWTERDVVRVLGTTAWPVTAEAVLKVTYKYENA